MLVSVEEIGKWLLEDTKPSSEVELSYEEPTGEDYAKEEQEAKPQKRVKLKVSTEQISRKLVSGFGFVFGLGLEWYCQQRIFKDKEEYVRAKRLYGKYESEPEQEWSEAEIILLEKYEVFLDLLEESELREDESKSLEESLSEWLGEVEIELHPGVVLLLTIGMIIGNRVMEIETKRKMIE